MKFLKLTGVTTILAAWLFSGLAVANDQTEPVAVNVGTSEFTVSWQSSIAGEPELRIYSDAAGENEVTGGLRREAFPLAGSPRPHWDIADRRAKREMQDELRSRGLMLVRVGVTEQDTEYFVEAGVRDEGGTFHSANANGSLLSVHTAPATGFVGDYRKAVIDFSDEEEIGSVAMLSVPGARSPLLAVVGDAAGGAAAAVFSLAALIDDETGMPIDPAGSWAFDVTHYSGGMVEQSMSRSIATDGEFSVASVSTLAFQMPVEGEIAYFEFDPIDEQTAGFPFDIRVTARTESSEVAEDFDGTALIESNGDLEGGASSISFAEGVAEGHTVTLAHTGEFLLTASDETTGAFGESNSFIVSTDWENWLSLHVDPEDLEDSMREQWLADPDGRGQPLLMRYAFDIDESTTGSVVEESIEEHEEDRFLAVSFPRLQYAPDVRYLVVGSHSLSDWEVVSVVSPGSPEWVTVSDNQPINGNQRRFLRVNIVPGNTFGFWQADEYGTAALNDPDISDPDADPGDYGVTNFERYALGMNAIEPDLSLLPGRRIVTVEGNDYQELYFSRRPAGEDIRYIVEATSDYPNWETLSEFGPGEPVEVEVRDTEPMPEEGYRIIRVRIEPTF